MKRIFLAASICAMMFSTSCLENNTYQNNKGNTTTTTTTTTTTDDKGGTTTTTTTTTTTDTKNSFHSNNGKFSINFKNAPLGPASREENNKAGMVQIITYIDQVSDAAMYVAMYKDYPVGAVTDANVDENLKLEAEAFMKGLKSKIAKTQEERLGGNKGLSFSGSVNDSIRVNFRSFFVGKRYYMFGTMGTEAEISAKDSKNFISSFELDN